MSKQTNMDYKDNVKNTFSFSREARDWSRLYDEPRDLFEVTMLLRRNFVLNYISRNFDNSKKILDLGCGTGVLIEKLLNNGMNVVGMDLSEDMLSLAFEKTRAYPQEKSLLLQGDSEALPFDNKRFDLIACLGVIAFLKDEGLAIKEMHRILRKNGILILSFRNKYTLSTFFDPVRLGRILVFKLSKVVKRRIKKISKSNQETILVPRRFNSFSLIERLKRNGFIVKEVKNIGYGPLRLNDKELFPQFISIKISQILDKIFNISCFKSLKWSSDVCVLVLEKINV